MRPTRKTKLWGAVLCGWAVAVVIFSGINMHEIGREKETSTRQYAQLRSAQSKRTMHRGAVEGDKKTKEKTDREEPQPYTPYNSSNSTQRRGAS